MDDILKNISDAAKSKFAEIPFPHRKDEYWRFADYNAWGTEALFPHFSKGVPESKPDGKLLEIERAAHNPDTLAFFDGQLLSSDAPQGVEIIPMSVAAEKYSADVCAFYESAIGKFDTLVSTRAQGGIFVIVSPDTNAVLNFASISKLGLSVGSIFFKLGENSKLRLIRSFAVNAESFGLFRTKFAMSKNSTLELATFKYSGGQSHAYLRDDFEAAEGAQIVDAFAELGVSPSRSERNFEIGGANVDIDTRAFVKLDGNITHDLRTSQIHSSGGSKSNLAVKAVVDGHSKLAFTGLVKVEQDAQKTRAYQSCRSLSLSDFAKTQASPILEIMANDVECSHGCTVAKPDFDEIFYMNQRGLSETEALRLITESFAATTFEKIGISI